MQIFYLKWSIFYTGDIISTLAEVMDNTSSFLLYYFLHLWLANQIWFGLSKSGAAAEMLVIPLIWLKLVSCKIRGCLKYHWKRALSRRSSWPKLWSSHNCVRAWFSLCTQFLCLCLDSLQNSDTKNLPLVCVHLFGRQRWLSDIDSEWGEGAPVNQRKKSNIF